jgi:hypothetical protein
MLLMAAGSAYAGSIQVFNTGVNGSGVPLPNATVGDPHYTLIAVPTGTTTEIQVLTSAGGYPVDGAWLGDNSISAWIGPNTDGDANGENPGLYTYQTTFDLTGFNFNTASLTGQWSADNQVWGGTSCLTIITRSIRVVDSIRGLHSRSATALEPA